MNRNFEQQVAFAQIIVAVGAGRLVGRTEQLDDRDHPAVPAIPNFQPGVALDIDGRQQTVPIAVIVAGSDWQPTVQIPIDVNLLNLPVLSDGSSSVAFSFQPVGFGGDWTIDDVYLDPFKTN